MIESQNMAKRKRDRACELRGRCAILREQQGDGPAVAGFYFMWPPRESSFYAATPANRGCEARMWTPLCCARRQFLFFIINLADGDQNPATSLVACVQTSAATFKKVNTACVVAFLAVVRAPTFPIALPYAPRPAQLAKLSLPPSELNVINVELTEV